MPHPPNPKPISNVHAWEIDQVLSYLQSQKEGLTYVVARQRLRRYGKNQIPKQRRTVRIAVQVLTDASTYLLVAIAAYMQHMSGEGWYVLGVCIFHACFDMWLTARTIHTKQTLSLLTNLVDRSWVAKVRRDRESILIPSRNLVLGDIVEIQAGDRPDVDLRLFESEGLQVERGRLHDDLAEITGMVIDKQGQIVLPESTPALECSNMVYAGTAVAAGTGVGIVVATGKYVYRQRRFQREQPVSLMHNHLRSLGRIWFVGISVAVAMLLAILGDRSGNNWYGISLLSVAIAISTYPKHLLRIATSIQLLGIKDLAKKGMWVRCQSAIDLLARISLIVPTLGFDMTINIENLDQAGIKWHGLIRASPRDADTLGKVLGIAVSCDDQHLEIIPLEDSISHTKVAFVAKTIDDLPLLRQADIGICTSSASQVLQNCAGLILPEFRFHYVPLAIATARGIFERLQHIVWQSIVSATSLVVLAILAVFMHIAIMPLPIIWIGAIATPLLALVFIFDPTPTNIMTRPATQYQSMWNGKYLHLGIAIATIVMTAITVFGFKYQQGDLGMLPEARTMTFTTLVFSQIFYTCSLVRKRVYANIPLIAIILFLAIAQAAIVHLPGIGTLFATTALSWTEWAIATLAATSIFWVEEIWHAN